jgi:hypothetical protein
MNNDLETTGLVKIIESFIANNMSIVMQAQDFSRKILDNGLIDLKKTMPFQIIPTEMFDGDGNVMCKIYVNLESPIYGFFNIELQEDKCGITCPKTYYTEFFMTDYDECDKWLESMIEEMEIFYQLSSAAENKEIEFCNLKINEMLQNYKKLLEKDIRELKEYIDQDDRVAIVSNKMYALAKDAVNDLSRAMLLPHVWVVFQDLECLPDPEEDVEMYVNVQKTNDLVELVELFMSRENYLAAPLYLAQRVLLQAGLKVLGYSNTDNNWVFATLSANDTVDLVLPPIDLGSFKVDK